MLTHSEKETILSEFPNIKLSYENIIHKKVYNANIYLAIPEGKKCFAWFTTFKSLNVCFILELTENKQITNIKIVNSCFSSDLAYGTILYGTVFNHLNNNFFTIEDIFFYKVKEIKNKNWESKFCLFKNIFEKSGIESTLLTGPRTFPSPAPIFPTLATAPDNELTKSSPVNESNMESTATVTKYSPIKEKTDATNGSEIFCPWYIGINTP